ncbi:hypothetical protein GC207_15675 [bacterium]|nr:hypothetical protein [bacterium]
MKLMESLDDLEIAHLGSEPEGEGGASSPSEPPMLARKPVSERRAPHARCTKISSSKNGMGPHWKNPKVLNKLRAIVTKRVADLDLREELFQRLWMRLWQRETEISGHSLSWVLKNCEWHLRDLLNAGRGIDARKRRYRQIPFPVESESGGECPCAAELIERHSRSEIYMHDIKETLHRLLEAPEKAVLEMLARDYRIREIAQVLRISGRTVIQRRKKIASLARRLGIAFRGEE